MFEHKTLTNLDEYFLELNARQGKSVYFYRINGYNESIQAFIQKYYEAARKNGVVAEGKIPNPDEKNLDYYQEIMGLDFQMNVGFITAGLRKWLPRMNDYQRNSVAVAVYDTLDAMRREGKNENMLKNAYIKFMCWLYYKFERIVNQLGGNQVPKILYEGQITNYELKLFDILSKAGCDIVLLQYNGDRDYLLLDRESKLSDEYKTGGMVPFPKEFNIKRIREEQQQQAGMQRMYGTAPTIKNCTNAWIKGTEFDDITKTVFTRGKEQNIFYNCFIRMNGVQDKMLYENQLYLLQVEIKRSKRNYVIVEQVIPPPSMEEIEQIRRKNYGSQEQMIIDLSSNIIYAANIELQRLMNKTFIDIISEESKKPGINLNKLTNKAVYLLCWLKRYQSRLFSNWKMPDVSCFIYLGGCRNENEALFLRLLSGLPVDVLILNPDLNRRCCLQDKWLYEINYEESMQVEKYPMENAGVRIGTAAYHAERELDTIMYQDSGIYRDRQYGKAVSITLQTMYEEISILWNQELKFRPNFNVIDNVVNVPVFFAKVSGVKDGNIQQYWSSIKTLIVEDTLVIKNAPYIKPTDSNPVKAYATGFYKNGRLQKQKIKEHSCYQYGFLREEIQEHILDKLQVLIEQKTIKGTFENGTEYTVIATALNLNKDIIRMIQKFDFTKKNPKLIYINTTEELISLEDSILTAFLNLIGFDVVFFVPTGYQSVEKFFNRKIMEEHQIGDYVYDLHPPDFDTISSTARLSWRDKIFKRGN